MTTFSTVPIVLCPDCGQPMNVDTYQKRGGGQGILARCLSLRCPNKRFEYDVPTGTVDLEPVQR